MIRPLIFAVAAVLAAVGTTQAQEVRRDDPSTWRWNVPDGPRSPGIDHHVLHSASMDRDVGYNVWLPPGYADSKQRYPVIYFLHGAGGNENSDAGGFSGLVAKQIKAKAVSPAILVFPNGALSGYQDRPEQKVMGETLIIKELIPRIDAEYRTIASRDARAIAGFSMGGSGAVRLALKYPDLFSAAGGWAAALGFRRGGADPVDTLRQNIDRIGNGRLRLMMVVGDKDQTRESQEPLVKALDELKVTHEYRVLPGVGHDLGAYYTQTGEAMVRYVAAGLAKPRD